MLSSASAERLVAAVFYKSKFARIKDHANVLIWKIKFLISSSAPGYFWLFIGMDITDDESFMCPGDGIAIFLDIDFIDLWSGAPYNSFLSIL